MFISAFFRGFVEGLLADHNKILNLIKDETRSLAEKYGDDRRTEIVANEVEQINVEDMIKDEDMVLHKGPGLQKLLRNFFCGFLSSKRKRLQPE